MSLSVTILPIRIVGAEIELKRQISELMAQNDGAPCTFVLVSSSARYMETLVQLSNSGYNTLVVYNPKNITEDHLAFISDRYCCTDDEFFSFFFFFFSLYLENILYD